MTKTTESTVAIIGLGTIGLGLASNLSKGHRPVMLAARDFPQAKALAIELGPLA